MGTPKKKPAKPPTPREVVAFQRWAEEESRMVRSGILARRIAAAEKRAAALAQVRGVLADAFAGASRLKVVVEIDGLPGVEFDLLTLAPSLPAVHREGGGR